MSYSCGSVPRANYFSNPDVDYLDKPTGTATEDCARAISENIVSRSERRLEMKLSRWETRPLILLWMAGSATHGVRAFLCFVYMYAYDPRLFLSFSKAGHFGVSG